MGLKVHREAGTREAGDTSAEGSSHDETGCWRYGL